MLYIESIIIKDYTSKSIAKIFTSGSSNNLTKVTFSLLFSVLCGLSHIICSFILFARLFSLNLFTTEFNYGRRKEHFNFRILFEWFVIEYNFLFFWPFLNLTILTTSFGKTHLNLKQITQTKNKPTNYPGTWNMSDIFFSFSLQSALFFFFLLDDLREARCLFFIHSHIS